MEQAKRLYIYEHKTFVEISEIIPVSDKTIRKWAKEFNWFAIKKDVLTNQKTTLLQAEYVTKSLGELLSEQLAKKEMPSIPALQAYRGLVRELKAAKDFDKQKEKEAEEQQQKPDLKEITKAAIKQAFS